MKTSGQLRVRQIGQIRFTLVTLLGRFGTRRESLFRDPNGPSWVQSQQTNKQKHFIHTILTPSQELGRFSSAYSPWPSPGLEGRDTSARTTAPGYDNEMQYIGH